MTYDFLIGEKLKSRILEYTRESRSLILISAYITQPAVEWLRMALQPNSFAQEVVFIGRFSPSDMASGGSDFSAIESILSEGWKVRALSNLHAKIYMFDESRMIVGSGNWTTNGLRLYGAGNEEAAIDVPPNSDSISYVHTLVDQSRELSLGTLTQMKALLQSVNYPQPDLASDWPETILPDRSKLYVIDFPFSKVGYANQAYFDNPGAPFAVIERASRREKPEHLRRSRAFRWLLKELNEKDNGEIYFGELSARLHECLADDPRPYRREIKDLLANLISYVEEFAQTEIIVDRPNHSQRMRLASPHLAPV